MTDAIAPWAQTATGLAVDLLSPKPDQISLADIAIALSRIPRFNGHSAAYQEPAWTVAEHSLLVEALMPEGSSPTLLLLALLHDAAEAYTGDMIAPMKAALRALERRDRQLNAQSAFHTIEFGLQAAIRKAFALPDPTAEDYTAIKLADLVALRIEADNFMTPPPRPWGDLPDPGTEMLARPRVQDILRSARGRSISAEFTARAMALIAARLGVPASLADAIPALPRGGEDG